jgi:hypothetical protein
VGILLWPSDSRTGTGTSTAASLNDPKVGLSAPLSYTTSQLILDDQFSGATLNTSNWTAYMAAQGIIWSDHDRIPLPYSAPNYPGTGYQSAMYGPKQVNTGNGLTLTAERNTNQYARMYPWISGVVTTEGKVALPSSGWYVQVKAKMPDMSDGMWPAIWFLPSTPISSAPEIDLFEGGWSGTDPNELMHSDYGGGSSEYPDYRNVVYNTRSNLSAGYHVYGIQYIPHVSVKYFFDGKLVFEQLQSDKGGVAPGTYELILQLQVATDQTSPWHTVPTARTSADSMQVSEVQAYS